MPENDAAQPNNAASPAAAGVCPHCKRKLLTQTSALCNWCGAKIDDEEYQMRAAQERQSVDKMDRDRVQESQDSDSPYKGAKKLKGIFSKFGL